MCHLTKLMRIPNFKCRNLMLVKEVVSMKKKILFTLVLSFLIVGAWPLSLSVSAPWGWEPAQPKMIKVSARVSRIFSFMETTSLTNVKMLYLNLGILIGLVKWKI